MNAFNRLLSGAPWAGRGRNVLRRYAETPANMLVIANRIDDITTIDPARSFEFAGSDVSRNVYGKLVNFDPLDLDAGYQAGSGRKLGRVARTASRSPSRCARGSRSIRAIRSGPRTPQFSLQRAVILNKTPAFILTQFGFTPENVGETIWPTATQLTITTDKRYATSFRAELPDGNHWRDCRQGNGHGQRG